MLIFYSHWVMSSLFWPGWRIYQQQQDLDCETGSNRESHLWFIHRIIASLWCKSSYCCIVWFRRSNWSDVTHPSHSQIQFRIERWFIWENISSVFHPVTHTRFKDMIGLLLVFCLFMSSSAIKRHQKEVTQNLNWYKTKKPRHYKVPLYCTERIKSYTQKNLKDLG